jgi:parallel beta-helix repeat protein
MDGPTGGKGIDLMVHNNVTIQNFSISGFYWGINLYYGTSCTVQENSVSGAYFGIELRTTSTLNTVQDNSVTGAMVGLKLNSSTQNTIAQNNISNGSHSIYLVGGANDNLLDRNRSESNLFNGIHLSEVERNILSNNVVSGNGLDGILLYRAHGTVMRYNEIRNNTYYGIGLDDTSGCVIKYNKISGNPDSGIHLGTDSPDNILIGNKLCGNGNGTSTFDVYNEAANRGSSNICANTSGYNDDNASTGCAFACGSGCVSKTTIYDCGATITESCTLNSDLVSFGDCFNVAADNITVDGGGFTIYGNGTGKAISAIGTASTTIRNFGIDNFLTGISLSKRIVTPVKASTQNRILGNRVENTKTQAVYLLNSTANTIESNILKENANGINLQGSSTGNSLSNNMVARSATDGIYFKDTADNNILAGNTLCASGNLDVNNLGTNTGTGTTCTKTGGTYHDDGKAGCTYACGICSDGTFFGECSNEKPKYCMEGILINDCVRCGCGNGNCNATTKACEEIPPPSGVCVGATKTFSCGDSVTESCTLNGHMASTGTCFTITTNNVTIDGDGYSITGDKTGKAVTTMVHDNITVKRLNIKNFYSGIDLYLSKGSLIEDCSVVDNEGPGIWIRTHTQNTTVRNNTVQRNDARGIWIDGVENNTIEGNTITHNKRGMYLVNGSTGNTIRNNTINDNQFDGIVSSGCGGNTILGNTLARNTVEGLALYKSNGNTIQSNNIRHHPERAVFLSESDGNTFSGNFVTNNQYDGVWLNSSKNNQLTGNTFCNNGDGTVYFDIDSGGSTNSGSNNMCSSVNNYDDSEAGTGCARACNTTGCDTGTIIYTCGDTVTQSCTMTSSLTSQGTCFTVGANNVNINGNGFSITGNNVHDTYGVYALGRSNVTIRNLEAYDFYGGVYFESVTGGVVTSSRLHNNKNGVTLALSSNNQVTNNTVNSNEFSGIFLGYSSKNNRVSGNKANGNGFGIRLMYNADDNDLLNNEIRNSTQNGVYFDFDTNLNELISNIICDNAVDIHQDGSNTGDNNRCKTKYNWNDTGTTGCSSPCASRMKSQSLPWLLLLLQ